MSVVGQVQTIRFLPLGGSVQQTFSPRVSEWALVPHLEVIDNRNIQSAVLIVIAQLRLMCAVTGVLFVAMIKRSNRNATKCM
jgi:hypothetical protein